VENHRKTLIYIDIYSNMLIGVLNCNLADDELGN